METNKPRLFTTGSECNKHRKWGSQTPKVKVTNTGSECNKHRKWRPQTPEVKVTHTGSESHKHVVEVNTISHFMDSGVWGVVVFPVLHNHNKHLTYSLLETQSSTIFVKKSFLHDFCINLFLTWLFQKISRWMDGSFFRGFTLCPKLIF